MITFGPNGVSTSQGKDSPSCPSHYVRHITSCDNDVMANQKDHVDGG